MRVCLRLDGPWVVLAEGKSVVEDLGLLLKHVPESVRLVIKGDFSRGTLRCAAQVPAWWWFVRLGGGRRAVTAARTFVQTRGKNAPQLLKSPDRRLRETCRPDVLLPVHVSAHLPPLHCRPFSRERELVLTRTPEDTCIRSLIQTPEFWTRVFEYVHALLSYVKVRKLVVDLGAWRLPDTPLHQSLLAFWMAPRDTLVPAIPKTLCVFLKHHVLPPADYRDQQAQELRVRFLQLYAVDLSGLASP